MTLMNPLCGLLSLALLQPAEATEASTPEAASTLEAEVAATETGTGEADETPVSLGYDRLRFLAPVFLGDTITVDYVIEEVTPETKRSVGDIRITNQDGALVAVGKHILKWVPNE